MSHHIYTTEAYVLKADNTGEADKSITFFTHDLGRIRVVAKGLRFEKSKSRFALQVYSKANISLVKGKNTWRITTSSPLLNLFSQRATDEQFNIIPRIFSLLDKMLIGEESNPELFKIVDQGVTFLTQNILDKENLLDFECILVLRILNNLGYVGDNRDLKFFVLDNSLNNEVIGKMKNDRQKALSEINRAIKESQL